MLSKKKIIFTTPDKYDNRLEWETRFLTVDYICAWYRRPGNHDEAVKEQLHDPNKALGMWMYDAETRQEVLCIEGSQQASEQLSGEVTTHPLRMDFVTLEVGKVISPYSLEQERKMYPTRDIIIKTPEEEDNSFRISVRTLTVNNMCKWYKRVGNHSSSLEDKLQNEAYTLGIWVFNPKLEEYEFFEYGLDKSAQQISDETLQLALQHPFKIEFLET